MEDQLRGQFGNVMSELPRRNLRRVCVFCGSKMGTESIFRQAAAEVGRQLVEQSLELVYGGGSVGLMGVLADTVLQAGGQVHGVIPQLLADKEIRHPHVASMHIVQSMHHRKALMTELSDAFLTLPGGYGTLEETFEVVTWLQLGIHTKPIGILNVNSYYTPLIDWLEQAVKLGFISSDNHQLLLVDDQPQRLLESLAQTQLPAKKRLLGPEQS